MSYVSLLKNIPEILSQPTGVAAIASLGIHGAIALIVPLMPVNSAQSSKAESPKAVGLMELTPADQSRLPQPPTTNQVALQQPQLPLQQPLPGVNLGNLGMPSTSYPPVQPDIYSQPALPVIPTSPNNYNLSSLPTRQSIQRLINQNPPAEMPRFTASSRYTPSNSPFVDNIDQQIRETQSLGINRLPQIPGNNEISAEPLKNPSPEAIDIGSTTSVGVSPPRTIPPENNVVQIPNNGEKLAVAPQIAETNTNQSELTGKKTHQLLAGLKGYNNLRENIRQAYPNIQEKGVIREVISTKAPEMAGTVLGRLVVDSDGKILDIKFQEETTSVKLQSKVREFFSTNPPQADKNATSSYAFQIKFQNSDNSDGVSSNIQTSDKVPGEKVFTPQVQQSPIPTSKDIPETPTPSANSLTPAPVITQSDKISNLSTDSNQKLIKKLRQFKEENKNPQ
ncbi:MAG: hypothetical protein ACKO3K_15800 [Cuspidothrix sp.]